MRHILNLTFFLSFVRPGLKLQYQKKEKHFGKIKVNDIENWTYAKPSIIIKRNCFFSVSFLFYVFSFSSPAEKQKI